MSLAMDMLFGIATSNQSKIGNKLLAPSIQVGNLKIYTSSHIFFPRITHFVVVYCFLIFLSLLQIKAAHSSKIKDTDV